MIREPTGRALDAACRPSSLPLCGSRSGYQLVVAGREVLVGLRAGDAGPHNAAYLVSVFIRLWPRSPKRIVTARRY